MSGPRKGDFSDSDSDSDSDGEPAPAWGLSGATWMAIAAALFTRPTGGG